MKKDIILVSVCIFITLLASLLYFNQKKMFGATIITTNSSDTLDTGRTNTNTSLTNLNTAVLAAGTVTSVGTTYPLSGTVTAAGNLSLAVSTSTPTLGTAFVYSGVLGYLFGGSSGTLSFQDEPSVDYATSTTWGGTTTRMIRLPVMAETVVGARCKVSPAGATVNVQFGKFTASSTMLVASSTANYNLFTTPLTLAATDVLAYAAGTPASSPVEVVCTPLITK